MASPWSPPQYQDSHAPSDRPWLGMAMLVAVPLLALILIRMLWSGSSLWFLTVGILLLGAAAVAFLAARPQDDGYSRHALAPETNRLPLVLAGLGVLFLAMLLLPNFAGGDDSSSTATITSDQPASGQVSDVSGSQQAPAQEPAAQEPAAEAPAAEAPAAEAPAGSTTYVVQDGDTLWDIALEHGTTVEAIVAANELLNPADLTVGEELIIPPGNGSEGTAE